MKRSVLFPLFALALSACTTASQDRIDLILTNGKIFTADPQHPAAEALAISGERIAAVGTAAQIAALASSNTRVIDLGGRTVVPGFNDAHFHTSTLPEIQAVELGTMEPTFTAVEEALGAAAANAPADVWLDAVVGGRVLDDVRANRDTLDAISRTHPIQVQSWAGHGSIYNSRALELLGFRDNEPDPPGGFFGRDATGRINGIAHEYAGYLAHRRFNALASRESAVRQLAAAAEMAARWGITSIQEMSIAHRADEQAALLTEANVPQRWRVIRFPLTIASGWQSTEGGPAAAGQVRIHGTKWILDGTPVERLALMRDPYQDRPGWKGRLNFSPNTIARLLRESSALGEQVMFHAVGDGAIETLLQAMESTGGAGFWRDRRVRVEHADFLSPDQIARAHNLGVVIVHNPLHSLPEMMHSRYTPDIVLRAQSLRKFLKAGLPVAIGSDGPNNPFLNLMLAVIHPANPSEAMTLEEAVIAYTRGAAYAELAEADKGMLRQGMLADVAVLSADIFTLPLQQLPTVESVLTIVGGKIIHEVN